MTEDLFSRAARIAKERSADGPAAQAPEELASGQTASSPPQRPLADRLRPQNLDEIVGQRHLLGEDRLFRRLVEGGQIPSMVLWGPPGTGKTTLAELLAHHCKARFVALSAVLSGVAELRKLVGEADHRQKTGYGSTLLFVDEIHRWSKNQQDALLPAVERGPVTLVGATTENPSFELNAALLSRATVFVLEALEASDLRTLAERALVDRVRGLGQLELELEPEALDRLIASAHGDARRLLNALEAAALRARQTGTQRLSAKEVEEAAQQRVLLYDKSGDEHYGVVSAFIKSMRGSDPDAAVYYLARMLEGGEDPRFILRRIVIFASEDVGLADPRALTVAVDAHRAFELVGLPEGVLPMTQAVLYLSLAPKSNSALTSFAAARELVRSEGPLPVPSKLLNATFGLQKALGFGLNYRYPHDHEGGRIEGETYLPDPLLQKEIYRPSENGEEPLHSGRRRRDEPKDQ